MTYPYALSFDRYREHLDRDYFQMRALAEEARTAAVPACPGWNGDELVRHTALVYLQKAETIRTTTKPQGRWIPEELLQLDPPKLLDESYRRLIKQFDSHGLSDPAESWFQPDQTVGFWIRRLAHETAIHRYDIEAALDQKFQLDEDLAVDGVDEVLTVMLGRGPADETASGSTVAVRTGGKAWSVTLEQEGTTMVREDAVDPAGHITGEPQDVLLWLWGRGPLPAGSTDHDSVAELRRRLAAAT